MLLLNLLPVVVTVGGIYMLVKLRFFVFVHPIRVFAELKNALSVKEARSSLSLALAGTLGIGNIVGVAVGISVGGAGSVFWLLVSAAFAAALKYSESAIAADFAEFGQGGMPRVLKGVLGRGGKFASVLYAAVCILLSLVMGGALQISGAVSSVCCVVDVPEYVVAAALATKIFITTIGGGNGIKRATSAVIPLATLVYILLALSTIAINASAIPAALKSIFASAFTLEGGVGGVLGFFSSAVIREGFSRGLLSNEAGAGTSSLSNSESGCTPAQSGLLGVCEVLFDTVILCTLTALAILTSVSDPSVYSTGVDLVFAAIGGVFGKISSALLVTCICAFAFSTAVCWYYYGLKCVNFVFCRGKELFSVIFFIAITFGAILDESVLVTASDYLLLILTVLTTAALMKSSDRIKRLSELSGLL